MGTGLPRNEADRPISLQSGPTERFVELAVFLFLIGPSMVLSFFAVKQGSLGFGLVAVATIFRDLALVSLVLFFLWRIGRSRDRHFGT